MLKIITSTSYPWAISFQDSFFKGKTMKKFCIPLLLILGLLLVSCGEDVSSISTSSSTASPVSQVTHAPSKTWHVIQHFSSTTSFLGSPQYLPDRNEQVTVARPWRIAWKAHLDNKDDNGFSLLVCQDESVGVGSMPECTTLVYNASGSGTTAPINNVYNDVELSMEIGGLNSAWSFDIEELN